MHERQVITEVSESNNKVMLNIIVKMSSIKHTLELVKTSQL